MNIFFRLVVCLGLVWGLAGCAPTVLVPGTINAPSAKGVVISSVKVKPFKTNEQGTGDSFARQLSGFISDEGHVKVVSGRAEGELSGTLRFSRMKEDVWTDSYEYKKQIYYIYYYKQQKSVTVDYELRSNGEVISGSYQDSFVREFNSGDSPQAAKASAWPEHDINTEMMRNLARLVVTDISPHKESVNFAFKNGEDENMAIGITYVQKQRYDQAKSIFRQIIERTPTPQDRAAAMYNLGLIYEMEGKFKDAWAQYRDANQVDLAEELYIDALTRIEKRVEQNTAFESQVKKRKK